VAAPLTPARREEIKVEAYRLSLQGHSAREIARKFGVDHHTISRYLKEEAHRRRQSRPDYQQYIADSHRQVIRRAWEELDRAPTAHAVAQLLHALNASLSALTTVTGAAPPKRTEAEIFHHTKAWEQGLGLLSPEELSALELLFRKVQGEISQNTNVLEEIIERYRSGNLGRDTDNIVELMPVAEEDSPLPPAGEPR
jgi:transposase